MAKMRARSRRVTGTAKGGWTTRVAEHARAGVPSVDKSSKSKAEPASLIALNALRAELIRERKADHPEQVLRLVSRAGDMIIVLAKQGIRVDRTTLHSHRRWAEERISLKNQ